MNPFTYSYPVKVYFGEKAAEQNLAAELFKHGKTMLLAYGGGSIKKNGVYDELCAMLKATGKEIVEFSGIMSNPTYRYIVEKGADKFAKFAERVWGVDPAGKSELEVANAGLDTLEAFIKEIGMPSNFRELGIPDDLPWQEIADSVTLTSGGYGHLTHEDVGKIFEECRG